MSTISISSEIMADFGYYLKKYITDLERFNFKVPGMKMEKVKAYGIGLAIPIQKQEVLM